MFTNCFDVDLVHFQWPVQLAINHWIVSEDFILKNGVFIFSTRPRPSLIFTCGCQWERGKTR